MATSPFGGDWQWTLKVLRHAPKSVYLDTSGSVMDARLLERCVRELGDERLLFATDMTMEGNVARVRDADVTEEQRENDQEPLPTHVVAA